jgi:hypothetical protein
LFVPGGGANAALQAHIDNPHDAHFANAIGVNPYYPPDEGVTGDPILTSVGGPVDGESVLDFINQFKDLIPPRPNSIGFSAALGGTGIPNWDTLNASGVGTGMAITGGYASAPGIGEPVTFSHFLVPSTVTTFSPTGLLFPADRGIVALYLTTSGNFFDSAHTTLVAALSLNDTAPPGVPNAAFNETLRQGQQANYVGSGSGLDLFSLTYRLPYLTSYSAYPGTPYGPFGYNFFSYQLAEFALATRSIATGNSQSFLLVHWKETYATTLSSIQPSNLTLSRLVSTNCYSAVPVSGNFDDNTQPVYNVNRHNVFLDSVSGDALFISFTSSPNGSPTTIYLSGVKYYNVSSGAGALTWTVDVRLNNLFANSFLTGSVTNPPNVPLQFNSAMDPMQMIFSSFGGSPLAIPYYALNKVGGSAYSASNTPQPTDEGEYQNSNLSIYEPTPICSGYGESVLRAFINTSFGFTEAVDDNTYFFNSYPIGSISTATYEPFVDELYRYLTTFDPTTSASVPVIPTEGNVFPSSTALTSGGPDLQVAGLLAYPVNSYNAAYLYPHQTVDYSGFPSGDGANHLRRYQRAFDVGAARNTGWIRLNGLDPSLFATNAAYNGTETTGHLTGGAIIELKIPGASGSDWLDLGRQYGDPGLVGSIGTSPYYGIQTGVVISGSDVYVRYQTGTNYTSNNGSGQFLLFVRVTLINGPGTSLSLSFIEWLPSTFTP